MSYGTAYIDIPELKTRKGGKDIKKMSNNTKNAEVSKAPAKKYQKSRGEHAKDILIAVLVAGVIAFIGGMHFANQHNAEMQSAVKAASAPVAQTEVKK